MFKEIFCELQEKHPLIHNITNYVTVNDCANVLLACGSAPIMADDCGEVEDITTICGGLNINIGTLNKITISAMILAGEKANALGHPIILDPVGAGASTLRTDTAYKLLDKIKFSVIRGNISEIKALALGNGNTKGVDADSMDTVTDSNIDTVVDFTKRFAAVTNAVIAITGAIDIVTDGNRTFIIKNGHPMMSKVSGTGCMLSAMTAAYVTANQSSKLEAVAAAVCAMGLCGELAYSRLTEKDGNFTYRNYILDAIYNLDGDTLESGAKYEIR